MQALYNSLVNGQPEYKEDGTYIIHPPTALHLHAARTLKQLSEINNSNAHVINQLQMQINQLQLETQHLTEIINGLQNTAPQVLDSEPSIPEVPNEPGDAPGNHTVGG